MEVCDKEIIQFQECIRDLSGYDFTDYSKTSLRRRLIRILLEYDLDLDGLIGKLGSDGLLLEKTVNKLTVHTTELFRDPGVWKEMHTLLLSAFIDRPTLRIWHPGCSTGQEVYSMMMILDDLDMLDRTRIYASDLSSDVLAKAGQGRYRYHFNQSYLENFDRVMLNGSGETHQVPRKHWKKYFSINESHDTIQMSKSLCSKPVYKKLDLVQDPNLFLVNFDLIVCRNVIIYFNYKLQNRVLDLFYNNLNDNGVLLMGVHESIIGPFSRKFVKKESFYFKQPV